MADFLWYLLFFWAAVTFGFCTAGLYTAWSNWRKAEAAKVAQATGAGVPFASDRGGLFYIQTVWFSARHLAQSGDLSMDIRQTADGYFAASGMQATVYRDRVTRRPSKKAAALEERCRRLILKNGSVKMRIAGVLKHIDPLSLFPVLGFSKESLPVNFTVPAGSILTCSLEIADAAARKKLRRAPKDLIVRIDIIVRKFYGPSGT